MPHAIACPVPFGDCCGKSTLVIPASGGRTVKIHDSYKSVRSCFRRYMARRGYVSERNGEFHKEGEPIEMISGKPGVRVYYTKEKTRFVFHKQRVPILSR